MRLVLFAAAVIAATLTGLYALAEGTRAQVPTRFFGNVFIDGQPAPSGTMLVAEANDQNCANTTTGSVSGQGPNFYVIDVPGTCNGPVTAIYFKVGARYAAQIGCFNNFGMFQDLNLLITGAAARPALAPGQCGTGTPPSPEPTPAATPTPTPMPTATAAPTPAPQQPFSLSILNVNSPCIPVSGQTACDSTRQALWTGNQDAWRARFQTEGRPAPSPDDVFVATLTLRIEAGDPGAIAAVAQAVGWPHVRINASRFRGREANEADEWVEVKNLGSAAQDMSGWSVRIAGRPTAWNFANGYVLQPGEACKFYTGAPMADPCGLANSTAQPGALPNDQGTIELWVNFLDLKAIEAIYRSDPNNQPPPPNLQGFS
jgi:hypothetical protein